MSAPRKIIVAPWMFETPHQNPVRRKNHDCDGDHTYHHDDVVRELVEALEFYTKSENWGMNGKLNPNSAFFTGGPADAALAKIAQEEG